MESAVSEGELLNMAKTRNLGIKFFLKSNKQHEAIKEPKISSDMTLKWKDPHKLVKRTRQRRRPVDSSSMAVSFFRAKIH